MVREEIGLDLSQGADVGTGESRLWLNPASESSPGLDAPDQPQTVSIEAFTLRQNASIGVVCVDDLKIGTAFSDVSAVLPSLQITAANGDVTITWTGGGRLICSDDVTASRASWIPVDGAVSPHVISPANAARRFYAVVVP